MSVRALTDGNSLVRWIRDLALLLVVLAVVGGAVLYRRHQREEDSLIQRCAAAVNRLETELKYRAATNSTPLNSRGWPVTIDPAWFDGRPPVNDLVSPHRPWVEIASTDEAGFSHPLVRMTVNEQFAQFWYNPWQGIVRARVPVTVSDERTLQLYNRINSSSLPSIFWKETPTPITDITIKVVENPAPEPSADQSPAIQPEPSSPSTEPMAPILPHPSVEPAPGSEPQTEPQGDPETEASTLDGSK